MTIEQDARTAATQARQHTEQLDEKVLNRAADSLHEDSSVTAEEREHVTQQRQEARHIKETMLSRAEETIDATDSADTSTSQT
ncbi:hypothetical protein N836_18260 [Leptolyngbya sp. Heron Island J]|uniref:hypothetical protein n=1 Tax=Leptolyngbya sp. Heron Island J TaxID=1385935 RepID=UPI0003B977E3|nr:hypothetical protein [Leptolyngbya sp. Heron Island J]ESA34192.1 hypothetical protein N836_18260 [Leptolyngbya sp. Heron Island J]